MAENEDSAKRGKGEGRSRAPIKVPVDMPNRMEEGAAIATFLLDLQRANAVWSRNAQMGGRAALLAAMRLCHALGKPGLDMPFRVMGEGLIDLERGKCPAIFQSNPDGTDTTNTIAEQNLQADIVCHLEALCKGTGMKQKKLPRYWHL